MGESGTTQKRAQVSTVAENLCGVQKKSLGNSLRAQEKDLGSRQGSDQGTVVHTVAQKTRAKYPGSTGPGKGHSESSSHSAPPPPGSQGRPGRVRSSLSSGSRVPLGLPTRVSRVRAPRGLLPPRCPGPSSAMPPKRPVLLASARSALRTRCARSRPRPIRPPPHPTGYFGLDP